MAWLAHSFSIKQRYFELFVLLLIITNCILLALKDQPEEIECVFKRKLWLFLTETLIFLCSTEWITKRFFDAIFSFWWMWRKWASGINNKLCSMRTFSLVHSWLVYSFTSVKRRKSHQKSLVWTGLRPFCFGLVLNLRHTFCTLYSPWHLSFHRYVFAALYTMEMILKIIGKGFCLHKFAYLRDPWNCLDFVVVILGWELVFFLWRCHLLMLANPLNSLPD